MTDNDIVTRLRELAVDCEGDGNTFGTSDCNEAADEIERLREEVSRLTILANLWESEFNAAVNALTGKGGAW